MLYNCGSTECWLACHISTKFWIKKLFVSFVRVYFVHLCRRFSNVGMILCSFTLCAFFSFAGILVNECHFIKYTEQVVSSNLLNKKSIFGIFLIILAYCPMYNGKLFLLITYLWSVVNFLAALCANRRTIRSKTHWENMLDLSEVETTNFRQIF